MLVFTAAAVALVLLLGTNIAESTFYQGDGYNISYTFDENNSFVGNISMTWDTGNTYTGGALYTNGVYYNGWGKYFYAISRVTYEGYYAMGYATGWGSLKMPLPSALENATLDGCSGCLQELDEDGEWWLTVTGEPTSGYGWIMVWPNITISQHAAYLYTLSGQNGFGTHDNNTYMEGRGFLRVYQTLYNFTGALLQDCSGVEEFPNADEEAMRISKLPNSLTSYWTNGTFYEGEFSAGNPNGNGSMTLFSGEIIEGQFYEGKPVCKGTVWFGTEKNCKTAANKKKILRKPKTFKGVCSGENKLEAFFFGGVPGIWLKN